MEKKILINGQEHVCAMYIGIDNDVFIEFNNFKYHFKLVYQDHFTLILNDGHQNFKLYKNGDEVFYRGRKIQVAAKRAGRSQSDDHHSSLKSPMPGKVLKIEKKLGDKVEKGEIILVMEAMKMEHAIKAPYAGLIKKLSFKVGDQVPGDVELVEVEEQKNA